MASKTVFNEDKVALLIGGIIFLPALGKLGTVNLLGWVVKTGMWTGDPFNA